MEIKKSGLIRPKHYGICRSFINKLGIIISVIIAINRAILRKSGATPNPGDGNYQQKEDFEFHDIFCSLFNLPPVLQCISLVIILLISKQYACFVSEGKLFIWGHSTQMMCL